MAELPGCLIMPSSHHRDTKNIALSSDSIQVTGKHMAPCGQLASFGTPAADEQQQLPK